MTVFEPTSVVSEPMRAVLISTSSIFEPTSAAFNPKGVIFEPIRAGCKTTNAVFPTQVRIRAHSLLSHEGEWAVSGGSGDEGE